jgi:hypothetical protein
VLLFKLLAPGPTPVLLLLLLLLLDALLDALLPAALFPAALLLVLIFMVGIAAFFPSAGEIGKEVPVMALTEK